MDIGSNTSLLLIAQIVKNRSKPPKILEDQIFFTRLAEGFSSKKTLAGPEITDEALKRQEFFFQKSRKLVYQYSVEKIKCVATEAGRKAMNAKKLFSLAEKYGFSLKIISAEEEAKVSRKGALFQMSFPPEEEVVVLDIGGASTEISTAHQVFSLPIGSVNLMEKFLHTDPPKEKEILFLMEAIQREIQSIPFSFSKNMTLVATAGTPTTLATLIQGTDKLKGLHGKKLSAEQVQKWWEYLFRLSLEKRKTLKGMPLYRADVLPAGLGILKQIMNQFQWRECVVSITGLRYGLLCQF